MGIFDVMIWVGAAITVVGLLGLLWCIFTVVRARRRGLSDDEMRKVLRSVLAINIAALMVSVLGLLVIAVGIFLG